MGHGSLLVALCETAWMSLGHRARVILFRLDLKFTNVTLTRIIYKILLDLGLKGASV